MISVIVPAYNAARLISRCIDSVLRQTYPDWELIVVNDGSTDDTSDILCRYASEEGRIIIVEKGNGGVGSARNAALEIVRGEYFTFLDSDDWLSSDYLETLSLQIGENDLLISFPTKVFDGGKSIVLEHPDLDLTRDDYSPLFYRASLHYNTSPWAKLYKTDIWKIKSVRFNEKMKIGEDARFLFDYILLTNRIKVINYSGYHYLFESTGSLTKGVYSIETEMVSYKQIYESVNSLVVELDLKDDQTMKCLNWLKGYYSRRVLNSLYHERISVCKRVELIKTIDYMKYVVYLPSDSAKENLLKLLLKNRLLCVYDMIRTLASIKRKYD